MHIRGEIALITGGASGLGQATAELLTKFGAIVGLVDVNQERLAVIRKELSCHAYTCNVADNRSVEDMFSKVRQEMGVPRILINCAGVATAGRVVGREGPIAAEHFAQVIGINLIGTFNLIRLMAYAVSELPPVTESGERGIIINTASVAAYEGQIGQAAYSASKAGVVGMTLPLAREFARFGTRVMAIAPGIMSTPMLAGMPDAVQESLAESVPFPHRLGKPEEYAALVKHIIENEYLNGSVIRLDAATRLQPK